MVAPYALEKKLFVDLQPHPSLPPCSLPSKALSRLNWTEMASNQISQPPLLVAEFKGMLNVSHAFS